MTKMIALQAVTPEALARAVPVVSAFEARKVVSAVHRGCSLDGPIQQVRRKSIEAVRALGEVPSLALAQVLHSHVDPFRKFVATSRDGTTIEAVRIPLERPGRFSVCVSSQAGCAMGCVFCATGRRGQGRDLEAWEIVEQVRLVRASLDRSRGERVHGVVFQGMGEPLCNLDNVLEAIEVMREPSALAIDARAMTLCTVGVPAGIRRLTSEAPRVRLAVSIGSARPAVRAQVMPVSIRWPLREVLEAAVDYARATRTAPMWVVTLLDGVNDTTEDAIALAEEAMGFTRRAGIAPRVSVVAYNPVDVADRDPFRRATPDREAAFRNVLTSRGVRSIRRYSGGGDVGAACGQLAGRA